jgi:hypothetical protein
VRDVRPPVQPPSDPRPGPSGQPRPPNPWTGWTPWTSNAVLQGLGDPLLQGLDDPLLQGLDDPLLQGLGDRRDVGPVRGRPVIALTETAATILATSGANLTYRRYIKPALRRLGDSVDDISGARA